MTQPQYRGPTYIKPIDPIAIARVDVDAVPVTLASSSTAFGDARVAALSPKAGWSFAYGINGRATRSTTSGGASITADLGRANLTVNAPNASAVLQTRRAMRYIPGIGGLVRGTTVWDNSAGWGDAGVTAIMGIGDAEDGFFVGYVGGRFGFLRRSLGSDYFTPLSEFNLDAGLADGTGPTGIRWHPAYGHPWQIQYQWLGYGAITLSVEDPATGGFRPVHIVRYAGTSAFTSLRNPQLPVRAELTTGPAYASGTLSMLTPSAMAMCEGEAPAEFLTYAWHKARSVPVTTSELPLVSIENATTFGGITNRVFADITHLNLVATINTGAPRSCRFRVYRGTIAVVEAALTGESFVAVNADSCMLADVSSSAVNSATAGLLQIYEYRMAIPRDTDVLLPHIILDPGEGLIVTAVVAPSGTADVEAVLLWEEPI